MTEFTFYFKFKNEDTVKTDEFLELKILMWVTELSN